MDYKNGKIYKILNDIEDDIYVGSTCQSLSQRMAKHRTKVNTYTTPLYMKMRELGVGHFYIELIEECPCDNVEQLRAVEGKNIREFGTINRRIEQRTNAQYYQDNKAEIYKRGRDWINKNSEYVKEWKRQYYIKNYDKIQEQRKQYKMENADKIKENQKRYAEEHKDEIYKRTSAKEVCACGSIVGHGDIARHRKTKKHQKYLIEAGLR